MSHATWPIDGRELVEINMDRVPVDAVMTDKHWSYNDGPPDDTGWRLVGVTADGEKAWAKFDKTF